VKIIDNDTVRHVAHLARISLDEGECAQYCSELHLIIRYISILNEIDTADVLPTSHAVSTLKNVYRKDILKPSLSVDEALKNAPAREGDFFKVPQIIEGK
jgi:aspartyl-tRNA(Asn)/glutamyl-tRNA(Gln) amidotransferase subunit C